MIPRWRMKHLMMYPFSHTRFTENMYEWLTAVALRTQKGMSRKWCYWFREHIVLCRRYNRMTFPGKRIWLMEPGWSLAPMILSHMVTSQKVLVTEDYPRISNFYIPMALEEVGKAASQACRSAGASEERLMLLQALQDESSPQKILELCQTSYHVGDLTILNELDSSSVDVCFSMGRLEHFTSEDLSQLLEQKKRILVPGGIASHIVDHRDHFWHFDKSIHCFHHLTYSDAEWSSIAKGRHLFRNRLLEKDYINMFEGHGFEVLASIHNLHKHDADDVNPRSLSGRYAELSAKDLEAAVSHFIVRRP